MVGREIIGQYVITRQLGVGGMGVVYLADQPSVGRTAVIKVMHPELSRDPQVAPRFELEARAASQLNHPHIITIYNHGALDDGTLFLAMEHCEGQSLEEAMRQGPLGARRAAGVCLQIADALSEAHRRGVVHRDLKPSNIMLTHVGRRQDFVKVLDFGIAKLEGVSMTRTGMMIGTPQYMSPEQFRGEDLDGRSDLYSLGVMLFEMVTGRLPFVSQSLHGYMHKHLTEAPPSLASTGLKYSGQLTAVVASLLSKGAALRYADAGQLMVALEACPELTAAVPAAPVQPRSRLVLILAAVAVALPALALAAGLLLRYAGPSTYSVASRATEDSDTSEEAPAKTEIDDEEDEEDTPPAPPPRAPEPAGKLTPAPEATPEPRKKRPRRRVAVKKKQAPPPSPAPQKIVAPAPYSPSASVVQLEQRLRKTMSTARMPPSNVEMVIKNYRLAMARISPLFRDTSARNYLRQLIMTYASPAQQLRPHERKSVAALSRVYMTMETNKPMSADQRKRKLQWVLKVYDNPTFKKQDRPYHKRAALIHLIKQQGKDHKKALGIR